MAIEKLNPMMRPRSVSVEARISSRSRQTSGSIFWRRLRKRTPTQTESHSTKKEKARARNGDLNSSVIRCRLVNSAGHSNTNQRGQSDRKFKNRVYLAGKTA